jgi:outer membrane usher protein FimD/PapC
MAHRTVNSHYPVHTGQSGALSGALSGAPLKIRDGFGSDTHGNGFECHYLPYFNSNTDTNTNIVGYEYKTDSSNSDLHSDIYLI